MKRRGFNQKGFTLVELALVITLMGILAVAATPNDPGSQLINLDAATKKVQSDLRYAQNLAMTTGDVHGLQITGAGTYRVYNASTGNVVDSPYDHQPMTEDLADDYLGVSFDAADRALDVRFSVSGQPTLGGGESIDLEIGSDSKSIQITATSGFVSIL